MIQMIKFRENNISQSDKARGSMEATKNYISPILHLSVRRRIIQIFQIFHFNTFSVIFVKKVFYRDQIEKLRKLVLLKVLRNTKYNKELCPHNKPALYFFKWIFAILKKV